MSVAALPQLMKLKVDVLLELSPDRLPALEELTLDCRPNIVRWRRCTAMPLCAIHLHASASSRIFAAGLLRSICRCTVSR